MLTSIIDDHIRTSANNSCSSLSSGGKDCFVIEISLEIFIVGMMKVHKN